MNPPMWSSPEKPISQSHLNQEHLKTLETAIVDAQEFDVKTSAVYSALDCLQKESLRGWGFTVYRTGLERSDAALMNEGFKIIKQHLGHE